MKDNKHKLNKDKIEHIAKLASYYADELSEHCADFMRLDLKSCTDSEISFSAWKISSDLSDCTNKVCALESELNNAGYDT